MDFFKQFSELLSEGEYATVVITKKGDKLTVSILPSNDRIGDEAVKSIPPIVATGTPEELDAELLSTISAPLLDALAMRTSVKDYEAAKKAAAEKTQKAKEEKEAKKKAEEAAKKKEEEKKAKAGKKEEKKKDEAPSVFGDAGTEESETGAEENPAEEEDTESGISSEQEPESAPNPEPQAPVAADVIKEDVQTLYKRGNDLYRKGDYQGARQAYESAKAVANANQVAAIDSAIALCDSHLSSSLFNA